MGRAESPSAHRCSHCLSEQDIEVLVQVAAGKRRDEVAKALFMTPANVAYHLGRVGQKFDVKGQAAMVAAAIVAGILASDRWPIVATGIKCVCSFFDSA